MFLANAVDITVELSDDTIMSSGLQIVSAATYNRLGVG